MAGYRRSAHTNTHPNTPAKIGGRKAKTGTNPPKRHTPAMFGGAQAERAHKHTHPNTPARNVEGQLKKVPTRTGPCCAPSACYPC